MTVDLSEKKRIHLIGIGGSGMSGIAEVLLTLGHDVAGSDAGQSAATQRLLNLGATVFVGHSAVQLGTPDVVVVSSAITDSNLEVQDAKKRGILVIPRAKMLAALMQLYYGIAIAGTHGKTTTTSFLASLLAEGGMDPTFVIGGLLKSAGCNAQLGQGRYFVAEADESDGSFLFLDPSIVVVTNIDADHMGTYDNDFNKLKETFLTFLGRVPEDGLKVLCLDDPVVAELLPQVTGNTLTYGFNESAQVRCTSYTSKGLQTEFSVYHGPSEQTFTFTLNLPGKHNVQNVLAAIAIAIKLGVDISAIQASLAGFQGIGRRLQLLGEFATKKGSVALVDDYGHHPRELAATVSALREVWPQRRLVMVFQPHRYTRTRDLWQEFVDVLSIPDKVLLLDIYPASEPEIDGIDSQHLLREIAQHQSNQVDYVAQPDLLLQQLHQDLHDGDVILMQGAGSIGRLAVELAQQKLELN